MKKRIIRQNKEYRTVYKSTKGLIRFYKEHKHDDGKWYKMPWHSIAMHRKYLPDILEMLNEDLEQKE